MNDQELLTILENGGKLSVPYFDGAEIEVYACDFVPHVEALPAFKNFLALPNEQRKSDARHLLAYCQMMMDAVGEEEILEDMDNAEPTLETIWNYADARHIFFGKLDAGKYAAENTAYVQIEGQIAWEPEHGLQMSWANGNKLVKVSACDGHPTNGHASANPENDQYIFSCYFKEFCTFPD